MFWPPMFVAVTAVFTLRAYRTAARERDLRSRWAQKPKPRKGGKAQPMRVSRMELENQVCEFCRGLSNGLKSGQTVLQCLMRMADDFSGPLGDSLSHAVRQFTAGVPLLEALSRETSCLKSKDFEQVIRVLTLFEHTGSDPAEALGQVSANAQERLDLRATLAAKLVDARMSAIIVAILPLVIGLVSLFANRQAIEVTLDTTHGRLLIGLGLLLWVAGSALCWRIANPGWLE